MVYAARKLARLEKEQLKAALSDYWYTCGFSLQDLLLTVAEGLRRTHVLTKVYVRSNLTCNERIEVSYYSSEVFKDICHLCTSDDLVAGQLETYSICNQFQKDTSKKRLLNGSGYLSRLIVQQASVRNRALNASLVVSTFGVFLMF